MKRLSRLRFERMGRQMAEAEETARKRREPRAVVGKVRDDGTTITKADDEAHNDLLPEGYVYAEWDLSPYIPTNGIIRSL